MALALAGAYLAQFVLTGSPETPDIPGVVSAVAIAPVLGNRSAYSTYRIAAWEIIS